MTAASDFSALPPLRDVISAHGLSARKALGQNFLLDLNLTAKIARAAGDLSGKTVFEIGPGPGGLTRALLGTKAEKIIAVEKDPRCVLALQPLIEAAGGRLDVVEADALEFDPAAFPGPRAIVANLPYNVATPLLLNWLAHIPLYDSLTLMFQKEVAQRLTAAPGTKAYGRLSVITQWLSAPKAVFDLPPSAFTPPPKVTSTVVHITPRPRADGVDFRTMEKLTAAAFGQRRKMLRSSLKNHLSALEKAGIDPTRRAEELCVADFVNIARFMA